MSQRDEQQSENAYGRLIREAKEEAFHQRRALRRELPNPSPATKQAVAAAFADYYDVLRDYDGEKALTVELAERIPVLPDSLLGETVEAQQAVPSRNRHAVETTQMPLVSTVRAEALLEMGKELDAAAKELGFAAPAKETTPRDEPTMEDLEALLGRRGQSDALNRLPSTGGSDGGD